MEKWIYFDLSASTIQIGSDTKRYFSIRAHISVEIEK